MSQQAEAVLYQPQKGRVYRLICRSHCAATKFRKRIDQQVYALAHHVRAKVACQSGQGTTEYAILVGVLVVIAIVAIALFRPSLEELWNSIADGINSL